MPAERMPEPWQSFLAEIDRSAAAPIDLHCLGGFAVSVYYLLERPTGDIDVFEVNPNEAKKWLVQLAGEGSALHRKHRVYLQVVTVASVPESYEDRLTQIFPELFRHLRLFVLDPYDLVLSKLTRNLDVDVEDVKHLARSKDLDLDLLEARYKAELRPIVVGPPESHDRTLRLWIEAINEERGGQ